MEKSMKCLRFIVAIAVLCAGGIYAQARQETPAASKQAPNAEASRSHRPHIRTAACDGQLSRVCVLTLERLRKEDRHHEHAPIGVKQGRLVVWVAEEEEEFRFNRFKRVQCEDETKEIKDPDDPGPFDKTFNRDRYERVKYAKVTGKVGNCYKHMIDVNHGKEKIDPHIMIESP
jgi:hypothetical protein